MAEAVVATRQPWYTVLYIQVLIAIVIGILLGHFWPALATQMKPLGDAFIALIRMMIAPVIFCTVVHGIASMRDMTKVGRVGLKTLVYFELVSTVALMIGLVIGELVHPAAGSAAARAAAATPWRASSQKPRGKASSRISWRSSRTPSWTPSPRAICCRSC